MSRFLYHLGVLLFSWFIVDSVAFAWSGRVVAVPDGDSLKVERQGKLYKVRLYGIDSPEYQQADWRAARDFLRERVSGRTVELTVMDRDPYGRVVALVEREGQLLNRELVRHGLAWIYPRYCKEKKLCQELEALHVAAREQRLGLWRADRPVPPWKWKRLNHGGDRGRRPN